MVNKNYWDKVYAAKAATSVSWYQEHAEYSLFGEAFTLVNHVEEAHHTPSGAVQKLLPCGWFVIVRKVHNKLAMLRC